jgi:hypothetical protein
MCPSVAIFSLVSTTLIMQHNVLICTADIVHLLDDAELIDATVVHMSVFRFHVVF